MCNSCWNSRHERTRVWPRAVDGPALVRGCLPLEPTDVHRRTSVEQSVAANVARAKMQQFSQSSVGNGAKRAFPLVCSGSPTPACVAPEIALCFAAGKHAHPNFWGRSWMCHFARTPIGTDCDERRRMDTCGGKRRGMGLPLRDDRRLGMQAGAAAKASPAGRVAGAQPDRSRSAHPGARGEAAARLCLAVSVASFGGS